MKCIILKNGLKLLLYPMPNTHSVTVGLYLRAGQVFGESTPGITHLLEHLYFRQMGNVTQNELYYRMESIGSTLRGTTYRNFLMFSMKVASCYLSECLQIFVDLIHTNNWSQDSLIKEKQVVINQILENEEFFSIEQTAREAIFKEHPLALDIMGKRKDVENITLNEILSYRKKVVASPNILICITGNFIDSNIEQFINVFSQCVLSASETKLNIMYPSAFHSRKHDIVFAQVQNSGLFEVNMSFDISYKKDDIDYLMIMNCILGEGVGSKLQKRIREELCYCSDIASYIERYPEFAVLNIRFSINKVNLLPCISAIVNVINDLKINITEEDLNTALPFYTTNMIFIEDDTEEMNFQQGYYQIVFNSPYDPSSIPKNKCSIEKIQTIARKVFICNNCCLAIMGNTKGITKKSIVPIISKLGQVLGDTKTRSTD